ncbi:MAG: hypothetical protein NZ534_12380, partial [Bacteroidia bacterium]|nr:hypothetical protein [Bacteroidia bacterium]
KGGNGGNGGRGGRGGNGGRGADGDACKIYCSSGTPPTYARYLTNFTTPTTTPIPINQNSNPPDFDLNQPAISAGPESCVNRDTRYSSAQPRQWSIRHDLGPIQNAQSPTATFTTQWPATGRTTPSFPGGQNNQVYTGFWAILGTAITPEIETSADALCAGPTATLNLTTNSQGDSYRWEILRGQTVVATGNLQSYTPPAGTFSQAGQYTIRLTITNACCGEQSATRSLQVFPPNITINQQCLPDGGILLSTTAIEGSAHLWQPGNLVTPTIVVYPYQPTTYSVTVSNPICNYANPTTITLQPLPTPTSITGQPYVCSGQNITLTAQGAPGLTYTWSIANATPSSGTGSSITFRPNLPNGATGTVQVIVSAANANGCVGSDTLLAGWVEQP